MTDSQPRVWVPSVGQGPRLTRAQIAAFVAAHPGRGCIWQDRGCEARLMMDPVQVYQGDEFDALAAMPVPARMDPQDCWAGWLSYDLAASQVAALPFRRAPLPSVGLRRFSGALVLGEDGRYQAWGEVHWLAELFAAPVRPAPVTWAYGPLTPAWDKARYAQAFAKIGEHLVAGETYQINLSHPMVAKLCAPSPCDHELALAVQSFAHLAERAPAPYGCFVDIDGRSSILSNSPELLFSIEPGQEGWDLCTGPIKGTRPRGSTPAKDAALAQELLQSSKDAAEHLMIVDLLRNDLVRVAQPGSVVAPAKPSLLTLPTVLHLETKIRARMDPAKEMLALWRALAPGGSVTGAPKRASVKIIDALEQAPRGVYCGSLFHGDASGFWASIAIRTGEARDGALHLRSGGGIVLDSQLDEEWEETLTKARAFTAGAATP